MSLEWILQQGGLLTVCGMLIWLLREQGKRTQQTADAYMQFGAQYAEALTRVSESLTRQGHILDRIEQNLAANHLCPVTQVSTELLREAADSPGGGRRKVDTILRKAMAEIIERGVHANEGDDRGDSPGSVGSGAGRRGGNV
jgi:hypothetical protein